MTGIKKWICSGVVIWVALLPASRRIDAVRERQWFITYLSIDRAHGINTGSGVIIGLPDTGVFPHLDFRNNLLRGTDTGPEGDGTGQVDQIGHGTEMAGLIASHGQPRDSGALGIAPSAEVLPIKSFGTIDDGLGLTAGIVWAVEHGAEVISIPSSVEPSRRLREAIALAGHRDSVVVASAGNRPKNLLLGYPAAIPGVLAVGAIGRNGRHATFSVKDRKVEICAPGAEIVTTGPQDTYVEVDGTSAAAAIVSGAAALVRSRFPELSAPEVIHRLTSTATDIGPPGRDDECGFGVLNIVKALTADVPPLAPSASAGGVTSSGPQAGAGPPERSSVVTVLGWGAGIVAIGGVVVFLALRRRRRGFPA